MTPEEFFDLIAHFDQIDGMTPQLFAEIVGATITVYHLYDKVGSHEDCAESQS